MIAESHPACAGGRAGGPRPGPGPRKAAAGERPEQAADERAAREAAKCGFYHAIPSRTLQLSASRPRRGGGCGRGVAPCRETTEAEGRRRGRYSTAAGTRSNERRSREVQNDWEQCSEHPAQVVITVPIMRA